MNSNKYQGIFPAFYACYEDNGQISKPRTQAFARYLLNKGVQGLYVCGSSGECIYLRVEERMKILEWVMEAVGDDLTIIAHVAANATQDSVLLAAHAEKTGAHAIAAIPPIYFKLPERAIAKYWNDIAQGAPNTDFIIYNIPQLAGVALSPLLCKTMCQNPRVVGVKNSSMAVQDIQIFKAIGGENFSIFNGPDEQFLAGRLMGASGGIGGTYGVMPELFLTMDRLINEEQAQLATAIQFKVNDLITKLCSFEGSMYGVIKEILRLNGMNIGGVRAPFINITAAEQPLIAKLHLEINQTISELTALHL